MQVGLKGCGSTEGVVLHVEPRISPICVWEDSLHFPDPADHGTGNAGEGMLFAHPSVGGWGSKK